MKASRILFALVFAFALVAALLGGYVTAYVQLGTYHERRAFIGDGPTNQVQRHYAAREWCLTLFAPAAAVESKWIGRPVYLTYRRKPITAHEAYIDDMP
jgi:hypothetical protein